MQVRTVLMMMFFCASLMPAHGQSAVPGVACVKCHEDEVKAFTAGPHAVVKAPLNCESCHGNGSEHVASGGDRNKIFSFTAENSSAASAKCLTCHKDQAARYAESGHSKGAMSCASCHSVHQAGDAKHELKADMPELCFHCHKQVPQQFESPDHHPVNDGKVSCSSCHSPHGEVEVAGMKNMDKGSAECRSCHKEQAGPYKYPHAAVMVQGCTGCHVNHGGQYNKLLKKSTVNELCNLCHLPALQIKGKTVNGHQPSGAGGSCISCHQDVHGSNTSEVFFQENHQN